MAPLGNPPDGPTWVETDDGAGGASAPFWWVIGSTAVIIVTGVAGWWYAHKAYKAMQKKEAAEARRDLEAVVANATELTDLSTRPSPSVVVLPPAVSLPPVAIPLPSSPPSSPPLSPLVLLARVVALFKR